MDTDKLKLNVLNLCSRIEGKKAIVIEDLKTGEAVEINRDEVFPAASLIKVPVLSALFRMAKENQIALAGKRQPHRRIWNPQRFGRRA